MKPRSRIRKAIKWTNAALVVVLMVVWAVSWHWVWWYKHDGYIAMFFPDCVGLIKWTDFQAQLPDGWDSNQSNGHTTANLLPQFSSSRDYLGIGVPYWLPLLAFAATWAVLWRHDRRLSRVEQGRCVKCGYDRTGLKAVSATCPECGAQP